MDEHIPRAGDGELIRLGFSGLRLVGLTGLGPTGPVMTTTVITSAVTAAGQDERGGQPHEESEGS
ncbi:hypothetical protein GCM10009672_23020 [Nesterenkonia lutea]